jgi:DNA-binding MarR family transcriptional regulator
MLRILLRSSEWLSTGGCEMNGQDERRWTFLTNHAHVLVCIAENPDLRGREIAELVGVSERRVQGIVRDLVDAGYVSRSRDGRRNHYTINPDGGLRHPLEDDHTVGELLAMLGRLS